MRSRILVAAEEVRDFVGGDAEEAAAIYVPDGRGGLERHEVRSIEEYERLVEGGKRQLQ